MNRSIFDGLALARSVDGIEIRYPGHIHAYLRANQVARGHGLQILQLDSESWLVRDADASESGGEALRGFFAELNGDPPPYPLSSTSLVAEPSSPLVSCIVVVNENLPFVLEQLLPSLAANSAPHAIEVILVCNGTRESVSGLAAVRSIESHFGAVSVAYNTGARASRGELLAFFHDDCVIDDPLWIDKCAQRLNRGADAVAGEYREMTEIAGMACPPLPVAKCVPLVLRAADFLRNGGFDEFHYIGYEDLDFTLALVERDKRVVMTDLRIRHFSGMSSTLKYCPVPGLGELYALGALPRKAIVLRFSEFVKQGMHVDGIDWLRAAMDVQLLHVLEKYEDLLGRIDRSGFTRVQVALRERIVNLGAGSADEILSRFKAIDRGYPNQPNVKS